ncbi:MAG: nitroreductase family protein [Thermodesulfobacteria bacterium]|nr:nitroreductase family protein [Thermodesulfobacteriota bacterium]
MEEVFKVIKERRSIRKYKPDPVKEEDVLKILEAAIWAPSGLNNQPWRFVLVWDKEVKDRLAKLTKYSHIVEGASCLIVVLLDKSVMYHQIKDHQSAGACIQNILLGAWALGIGSCWLGEILKREKEVKETLGLDPDAYELSAVIALGYPDDDSPRKGRHPLNHFILKKFL